MKKETGCAKCGNPKSYARCLGCEVNLCESCAILDLVGTGCGCVWPVYYCIDCAHDPYINPHALFKDKKPS
ncbi:MAG TPA: hypothetical protein P5551_04395 [Syntrophales bacterium]|jgi:hypothetical protein|nr:hypothetical protein [Syntrophales bacterium]